MLKISGNGERMDVRLGVGEFASYEAAKNAKFPTAEVGPKNL
jgi:hypothetical protein